MTYFTFKNTEEGLQNQHKTLDALFAQGVTVVGFVVSQDNKFGVALPTNDDKVIAAVKHELRKWADESKLLNMELPIDNH